MRIRLPIDDQRDLRRKAFLLGPRDLSLGPLEGSTSRGSSPTLAVLTNGGDHHFQPIPELLPSQLKDTDNLVPDRPSDIITPTSKILHNRTGYFGQDALKKLKQNWPARSGRGYTTSPRYLPQHNTEWVAPRHGATAQDAAVVEHPGNVQGRNDPYISFRS